jgi:hypothetical protein
MGRMAEIYSTPTLFLSSTLTFESVVSASPPEVSGMAAPLENTVNKYKPNTEEVIKSRL